MSRRFALGAVLLAAVIAGVDAREPREDARIEGLIKSVEALKGARFVRNGADHDAAAAASHLRLKLKRAGKRIKSAEEFIEHCASRSSFTGERYKIKPADGQVVEASAFFKSRLKEIDARAK